MYTIYCPTCYGVLCPGDQDISFIEDYKYCGVLNTVSYVLQCPTRYGALSI